VVGLPELGDDEEVLTLHDTILDSTGDTLTAGLLISVICCEKSIRLSVKFWFVRVKREVMKLSRCGVKLQV
jgi:hypothetical protein